MLGEQDDNTGGNARNGIALEFLREIFNVQEKKLAEVEEKINAPGNLTPDTLDLAIRQKYSNQNGRITVLLKRIPPVPQGQYREKETWEVVEGRKDLERLFPGLTFPYTAPPRNNTGGNARN